MTRRRVPVGFGIALAAAVAAMAAVPAGAADPESRPHAVAVPPAKPEATSGPATASGLRCLTRAEQRARSTAKQVVPLAKAVQAVKARRGELLRARLCEQNGHLVYLLTVLPRGGKVVRATVDAATGALVTGP